MMNKKNTVNYKKERLSVLILDQGRQTLPFLKSCAKAGYYTIVVCNSRLNENYFSRYPSKRLIWPSYSNNRLEFERKLINFLKSKKIDVTLSLGDVTADILSKNKEEITKYTNIVSPDYPILLKAANKYNLMKHCMENNLPCPKTYLLNDNTIEGIGTLLEFPVIIKPTRGVGAIGVEKANNLNELVRIFNVLKNEYNELIVQEYLPHEDGIQYLAEAFVDANGKMKVCMVLDKKRFFPLKAGTSSANTTISHPEITKITKVLLEGLNWRGPADVDYILDPKDNVPKILEINPRVTASIKIGFLAGIDYADLHIKLALGRQIPEIKNYKLGIYQRNFFLEILWFFASGKNAKSNTTPPFFKLYGRDMYDQVFSLDDPFTGLGFFLHMVKKYLIISNFKSKFHR